MNGIDSGDFDWDSFVYRSSNHILACYLFSNVPLYLMNSLRYIIHVLKRGTDDLPLGELPPRSFLSHSPNPSMTPTRQPGSSEAYSASSCQLA